ncbi:MAG: dipeptidase PepE [Flavobacteriaceae bacterium]|nr:dipeptidase PepE [Psychroflexus sp.]
MSQNLNCIIASTSTIHGSGYLAYLKPTLKAFFKERKTLVFIPFARPGGITHDAYTDKVREALGDLFDSIKGLHEFENQTQALKDADAIFTGGGNTFLLCKMLHDLKLMTPLADQIKSGTSYLGTSAGSNICGLNMQTTNDMPIVYPPSFETMGLLNFNINAHYLDPNPDSTHKGETRETRLKEFQAQNKTNVIGLREGSYILAKDGSLTLEGDLEARIFEHGKDAYELNSGIALDFL